MLPASGCDGGGGAATGPLCEVPDVSRVCRNFLGIKPFSAERQKVSSI